MTVLVSACLLGRNCKYNGGNNEDPAVLEFVKDKTVIEVCPEAAAGLGTPRTPMEIVNGRIIDRNGVDLDEKLRKTVEELVRELSGKEIHCAVLKSRSPTCGVRQVYDGSFSGRLVDGAGVFARALQEAGIPVVDAEELHGK